MKPNRCRLCEHEHRNNEPHIFPDVATPDVATRGLTATEQKVLKKALVKSVKVVHSGEVARVQKWREANRERYNKRMREYRAGRRPLGIPYG